MKERVLKGWNWMRMLRLFAGIAVAVQGLFSSDWFLIIAGVIFSVLALLNTGCCATGRCGYTNAASSKTNEKTTYEEVV